MPAIQHLEQHPPVIAEPKNPHPDLHRVGALLGAVCSLLALMMCVFVFVNLCVLGVEVDTF
jgi:hypothetical protein